MRRRLRAQIWARYLGSLLWEFRGPIGVFGLLVIVGGWMVWIAYPEPMPYVEACYAVFLMIFMEPYLNDFPDAWYLQLLFFAMPIIGLGAVADSVARLANLTFTRKNRLPEWHRMVAASYRSHVIVIGLGTVGHQVVKGLLELGEPVVVIERPGVATDLLDEVMDRDVPVVRGDARLVKTLEVAGVRRASAIVVTTSDDLANLDAALTARDLNPDARVVVRLFDESLANKVAGAFALPAISTAHVAAPSFVAAATGRKVYQGFQLAGQALHLTDLTVCPEGGLVGCTIGALQSNREVNVVMHLGPRGVDVNPAHGVTLGPGDVILVIAPIERLTAVEASNRPGGAAPEPVEGIHP